MVLDFAADGRCPPIRFVRRTSMLVLIRLKLTCSGRPADVPAELVESGCGSASSGRDRFAAQTVGRSDVHLSEFSNGATWSSATLSLAPCPLRQTHHNSG